MCVKFSIIFLLIISYAMAKSVPLGELQDEWTKFKTTHERKYESEEEEGKRFAIFKENFEKIKEHNKKFDAGQVTYTQGINQFADLTPEEFKKRLGLRLPQKTQAN